MQYNFTKKITRKFQFIIAPYPVTGDGILGVALEVCLRDVWVLPGNFLRGTTSSKIKSFFISCAKCDENGNFGKISAFQTN